MSAGIPGKVALVTGGSSGIGRAAALAFAREGAGVVVAARRTEQGEESAQLIREAGGEGIFVRADMSRRTEIEGLVEQTLATYGRLDFAFNNAGIEGTPFIPTADYAEEAWDEVIAINLKGVWLCMKFEIPAMLKQGGAIVNMASVSGLMGGGVGAAYTASKHGVVGLTREAAMEYAGQGVRVNAVAPAVIRTPMTERALFGDPESESRIADMHPVGRIGTPEEVAEAVVWLCSDAASFITGHTLPIDGGVVGR